MRTFSLRTICLFLCWLLAAPQFLTAAPPTLERFFPGGLQRGAVVEVNAEGSFATWPLQVCCDSPGINIECLEDKNKLRVHAEDLAACGVHWVRFHNEEGVTAAKPLIVGTAAESIEVEPNDGLETAQAVQTPSTINGRLNKRGDVDVFAVQLQQGQCLVGLLGAQTELGSPMDGVLQIVGPGGHVAEQNDDARGLDSLLVYTVPTSGTYFLRVFGFPATPTQAIQFAGGKEFVYRLTVTTEGYLDHTLPLAVSAEGSTPLQLFGWNIPDDQAHLSVSSKAESRHIPAFHPELTSVATLPVTADANLVESDRCGPAEPQAVNFSSVISGRIGAEHDVDVFRVSGTKGQVISASVEASTLGSLLDPHLTLCDSAGKVLVEVDDKSRQERDCNLQHELPADGEYLLQLRDVHHHGGFRYFYRLSVGEAKPDFRLTVSADTFVVDQSKDEPLEIEVNVERRGGFKGPIEIAPVGLPDNLSCAAVVSVSEGETAKKIKLKISGDSEEKSSSLFRIRGTSQDDEKLQRTATFAIPFPAGEFEGLWVTVK